MASLISLWKRGFSSKFLLYQTRGLLSQRKTSVWCFCLWDKLLFQGLLNPRLGAFQSPLYPQKIRLSKFSALFHWFFLPLFTSGVFSFFFLFLCSSFFLASLVFSFYVFLWASHRQHHGMALSSCDCWSCDRNSVCWLCMTLDSTHFQDSWSWRC